MGNEIACNSRSNFFIENWHAVFKGAKAVLLKV